MKQTIALLALCLTFQFLPGHLKRMKDGDTFVLYSVNFTGEEIVRLNGPGGGVNTPEKGMPLAVEATAFTHDWLMKGPAIMTVCERDSFGRLLTDVTRGDEDLASQLIAHGLAKKYK